MPDQQSVPSVPQIPQIPAINVEQASPLGGSALDNINAQVDSLSGIINRPLPSQYSTGTSIAQPRVPTVPQYKPVAMEQPISNQATSVQHARHHNAVAGLANMIGQAGQRIQEKKNENLKQDLTEVMSAKQNIANAKAVLAQDPNNKMAQGVLQENMKSLNAILSDPKKQKMLAKALDISYTDPEKNKTPEVKAYQEALKEFKAAGPFTSDNPAEHSISLQALSPGGSNAPGSQANQKPAPKVQPQVSATPYADAAIKKDLPTMENNPLYASALKQQEDAQKQMSQYVIPQMIKAQVTLQQQNLKDVNSADRARFKGIIDLNKAYMDDVTKAANVDAETKAKIKAQGMRDATAMAQTKMRVDAMMKVAEDNRIGREDVAKIRTQAKDDLVKQITAANNDTIKLDQAKVDIQNDKALTKEQKESKLETIGLLQKANSDKLKNLYKITDDSGLIPKQQDDTNKAPLHERVIRFLFGDSTFERMQHLGGSNVSDKSAGTKSESSISTKDIFAIGASDSDEPDTDSDDYGDDN